MAELEYFYAGYSGYAYLGSRRFMQIARESGNEIKHRPFDLRYLLDHNGCQPFDERTEAYNSYFFVREIERWSEYRNAPIAKAFPTYHSNSIEPSNKMLIAAMDLGLDFFDATISRTTAWVIGVCNMQKALLRALLLPLEQLRRAEAELDFTKRLAVTEEIKDLPFGAVWAEFCAQMGTHVGQSLVASLEQ